MVGRQLAALENGVVDDWFEPDLPDGEDSAKSRTFLQFGRSGKAATGTRSGAACSLIGVGEARQFPGQADIRGRDQRGFGAVQRIAGVVRGYLGHLRRGAARQ